VSAQPTPKAGAVTLKAPVLSFNDTGLIVSDGINRNGLWDVDSANIGWEFSFDQGQSWTRGQGSTFEVKDDGAKMIWVRARDVAGNPSVAQAIDLKSPSLLAHDASGNPLQPSVLASGLQTHVIHGVVLRGDADHVRWDVPQGQMLMSFKLVHYASDDFASYALQPSKVFDAGMDTTRLLAWGQIGLSDLNRNVLAITGPEGRGEGPMTLRFQQNGPLPTPYAIELTLAPAN
jgi:hypothetical protein